MQIRVGKVNKQADCAALQEGLYAEKLTVKAPTAMRFYRRIDLWWRRIQSMPGLNAVCAARRSRLRLEHQLALGINDD